MVLPVMDLKDIDAQNVITHTHSIITKIKHLKKSSGLTNGLPKDIPLGS
jgi:hypothetical protein